MSTKRFDVYAPVIIPTLCRYNHFKRCIDSLSKCIGAEFTDVYIGIDYPSKEEHWDGYRKICNYVENVKGFNHLFVIIRDKNYGVPGNVIDLKETVRKVADRYILSEDDNEFAPSFLEYMNDGLTRYKDTQNVIRICGAKIAWGRDIYEFVRDYDKNAFPAKDYNASGVGVWFDKYEMVPYTKMSILKSWRLTIKAFKKGHCTAISRMLHQLNKNTQLPDVCLRLACAFHDYYCIFPSKSKVKNWGYDGSGLFSDNNTTLIDIQELDTAESFIMDDFEIKDYSGMEDYVLNHYSDGAMIRVVIMIKYLYYRLTNKNLGNSRVYNYLKKKLKNNR